MTCWCEHTFQEGLVLALIILLGGRHFTTVIAGTTCMMQVVPTHGREMGGTQTIPCCRQALKRHP